MLLVTGPLTRNLVEALEQAYTAMPEPKFVVAVGDCAVDGGVFKGSYAVTGGVGTTLPVDLLISGCPPTPERILAGLRALLEANARSQAWSARGRLRRVMRRRVVRRVMRRRVVRVALCEADA